MRLARLRLADSLYSVVEALAPFVTAVLRRRHSLPLDVLARLGLRAARWLLRAGDRIAPELTRD